MYNLKGRDSTRAVNPLLTPGTRVRRRLCGSFALPRVCPQTTCNDAEESNRRAEFAWRTIFGGLVPSKYTPRALLCLSSMTEKIMRFACSGFAILMFVSSTLGQETRLSFSARSKAVLSPLSGKLGFAGRSEPVEVIRDTWGVPHIYAKNQHDLFFAQGVVVAQDRLFQIECLRRVGNGD